MVAFMVLFVVLLMFFIVFFNLFMVFACVFPCFFRFLFLFHGFRSRYCFHVFCFKVCVRFFFYMCFSNCSCFLVTLFSCIMFLRCFMIFPLLFISSHGFFSKVFHWFVHGFVMFAHRCCSCCFDSFFHVFVDNFSFFSMVFIGFSCFVHVCVFHVFSMVCRCVCQVFFFRLPPHACCFSCVFTVVHVFSCFVTAVHGFHGCFHIFHGCFHGVCSWLLSQGP